MRLKSTFNFNGKVEISIHAPIVGCDEKENVISNIQIISIHAPIVGCDFGGLRQKTLSMEISIHAPIVGCDKSGIANLPSNLVFQSTHPSWGAT